MVYRSSFSQHNVFSKCKLWWFFLKVKELPVVSDMENANAGNVVHKTLQEYYNNKKPVEEIKQFFTKVWDGYKFNRLHLRKDEYWNMILNGINLDANVTSTELKIFYDDCLAYIDVVDTNNHVIRDWKSSKRTDETDEEYKQQGLLYAWIYFRKFNVIPKEVVFHYLRYLGDKGQLIIKPTDEDIKQVSEWYSDILKEMEELVVTKQPPIGCKDIGKECAFFCPYSNECFNKITFTLRLSGSYIKVDGLIPPLLNKGLEKKFSYELKNAHWIKKNYPQANTTVMLWKRNKQILPIGFLDGLKKTLNDYAAHVGKNIEIVVVDERQFNNERILMPDKFINNKELREYQEQASNVFLDHKIGLLEIGTGGGKCFAKGTKVLMYDLSIKTVEEIKVGDKIMGDDGTPRKVLSLSRGRETLYKIKQKLAEDYIVNKSHILSLRRTITNWKRKLPEKLDIPLTEYLEWTKNKKRGFKGYKESIERQEKKVLVDPYFLGLWLGDGGEGDLRITNVDAEVINYLKHYAKQLGMGLSKYKDRELFSYAISNGRTGGKKNKLLEWMRSYKLIGNKHIPFEYIDNSKRIRLELLAGLIDTDGYVSNHRCVVITQKRKDLINQVYFIANSLGFYCKLATKKMTSGPYKGDEYAQVTIRGNLKIIPTKIKRKILCNAYYPIRYNGNKIEVEELNKDNYYGFVIDGNKRFLLGDFTVVHNTEISIEIIRKLGMKTLFIVDKRELLRQTKERIEQTLGIEVGKIGEGEQDIKPITVATIQTLIKRRQELSTYLGEIRLVVFDECHKVPAKSYAKISTYLSNTEYRLGLTATNRRDDGNDMLIQAITGPQIYNLSSKVLIENGWLIKPRIMFYNGYMTKEQIDTIEEGCKRGLINETEKYPIYYDKYIVNNNIRNNLINTITANEDKVLILVKLVSHGKLLEQLIPQSRYLFGETPADERKELFSKFLSGEIRVLISTISITGEGIDLPHLQVVVNASANRGNVRTIQALGRVLRILEGKKNAKYIDFIDESWLLKRASIGRKKILYEQGHDVEVINVDETK